MDEWGSYWSLIQRSVLAETNTVNTDFDEEWYISRYPDVKRSGLCPLAHYNAFGKKEGRHPCPNRAYDLELDLWSGNLKALEELRRLAVLNECYPQEFIYACWVLSCWYVAEGDYSTAHEYIEKLALRRTLAINSLKSHALILLVVSILINTKKVECALFLLDEYKKHYWNMCSLDVRASIYLAKCSAFMKKAAHLSALDCLNVLYKKYDLEVLRLSSGRIQNSSELDRLKAKKKAKFFSHSLGVSKFPKVSVIVPVYNSARTVETAVRSLLNQTWPNLEIILVDDGSTDTSYKYLLKLSLENTRIRIFSLNINQGAYVARNHGLKNATGDYITVHDADDFSHSQKIEKQVQALECNKHFKASISHWARCYDNLVFGCWKQEKSWVHRNVSSLMFRREVFDDLGFWDSVSINADSEYYYRILRFYGKNSITEVMPGIPLAFGRTSKDTLTTKSETHFRTQFGGVRKDYMDAAHGWHRSVSLVSELYLKNRPVRRPFKAPEQITPEVLTLGSSHIPYYLGESIAVNKSKRVLLCGHMAEKTIFGAERSLIDMAKALSKRGWFVVVSLPKEPEEEYKKDLLKFASVVVVTPYHWWKSDRHDSEYVVLRFQDIIKEFDIRLVGVNTITLSSPIIAAKELNISSVIHVRELPEFDNDLCELLGASPSGIFEKISSLSTGIIANSRYTKACIDLTKDIEVLPNPVNVSSLGVQGVSSLSRETYFSLISSNLPKKGVDVFVQLARMAESEVPLAKFRLFGPENNYIKSIVERGLPKNLELCGYKSKTSEALESSNVVLSLSEFQESFGRTVAEAMAAGRPVIGYRWGAVSELVDNGNDGFLVHYGDHDGLLRRVKQLAEDRELLIDLGHRAKQKIQKTYAFSKYAEKIDRIYSKYLELS